MLREAEAEVERLRAEVEHCDQLLQDGEVLYQEEIQDNKYLRAETEQLKQQVRDRTLQYEVFAKGMTQEVDRLRQHFEQAETRSAKVVEALKAAVYCITNHPFDAPPCDCDQSIKAKATLYAALAGKEEP
jgi:hypothetical protein